MKRFSLFLIGAILMNGLTFGFSYGTATVHNEIDIFVSTGGSSEPTHTGNAEAKIFLETEVDGDTVEKIEKHIVAGPGEVIDVHESTSYEEETDSIESAESREDTENISIVEDFEETNTSIVQVDTITNSLDEIQIIQYNPEDSRSIVYTILHQLLLITFFPYATFFFTIFGI